MLMLAMCHKTRPRLLGSRFMGLGSIHLIVGIGKSTLL